MIALTVGDDAASEFCAEGWLGIAAFCTGLLRLAQPDEYADGAADSIELTY